MQFYSYLLLQRGVHHDFPVGLYPTLGEAEANLCELPNDATQDMFGPDNLFALKGANMILKLDRGTVVGGLHYNDMDNDGVWERLSVFANTDLDEPAVAVRICPWPRPQLTE